MVTMPKLSSYAFLALCICTFLPYASAKPAKTASHICRTESSELPAKPTAEDVKDFLGGSRWMYFNPNKKYSTWESKTWRFGGDGELVITTNHVGRPRHSTFSYSWKIRRGNRLVINIGRRRYRFRRYKQSHGGRSSCLVGPQI